MREPAGWGWWRGRGRQGRRSAEDGSRWWRRAQRAPGPHPAHHVEVRVQLVQGREPQSRVELVLKGSGAVPGGLSQDALAFTDAQGFATFHVLAGTAAGTHRLSVAFANGAPVGPAGVIQLTTTARARELRATAAPGDLELWEAGVVAGVVGITVRDLHGNLVAGVPLQLGPLTATLAGVPPARATDERGQAAFAIAPQAVRREGDVGIFSGGARIGSFTVRLRPVVLSEQRTRFLPVPDERGVVGTPLAQPLVLEVRDASGPPVAGQSVSFTATGARVEPAVVSTDSSGVARVRVTFGERAGPVAVTAKVRTITRSVTLTAEPGPAHELAVLHDSARVIGPLALRSRQPVALQVLAHDSYGNETPLADFVAAATGPEIHLNAATVSGSEGLVTLEARRRGSADLEVRAAGLVTRVPVQVALPVVAQAWVFGARGSWTGFTYAFAPLPNIHGRPGVRGEFFAGRALTPQLRAELVGGLGALNADTGAVQRSVSLTQAYLRAEYTLVTDAQVMPVVSLGGGIFRMLSDDPRHFVYHNSLFWLIGAGADITISPRVVGEVRFETQQLNEMTSSIVNGHVGALTIVEAGIRLSP